MGLSMYLDRVKKLKTDITPLELRSIDSYLDWKEYLGKLEPNQKGCSFSEWDTDVIQPNDQLVELYRRQWKHRYAEYDIEKRYGFKTIHQNIIHWTKANAIHRWFVENIQKDIDDCQSYFVTKEDLINLQNTIDKVLKNTNNVDFPKIAEKYLPTQKGFFFGTYDYDEWYIDKLKHTSERLKDILENPDFDDYHYIYSSSW